MCSLASHGDFGSLLSRTSGQEHVACFCQAGGIDFAEVWVPMRSGSLLTPLHATSRPCCQQDRGSILPGPLGTRRRPIRLRVQSVKHAGRGALPAIPHLSIWQRSLIRRTQRPPPLRAGPSGRAHSPLAHRDASALMVQLGSSHSSCSAPFNPRACRLNSHEGVVLYDNERHNMRLLLPLGPYAPLDPLGPTSDPILQPSSSSGLVGSAGLWWGMAVDAQGALRG